MLVFFAVQCAAVARSGVGREEGDVRLEQQDCSHASVGEEGIAVGTVDDVDTVVRVAPPLNLLLIPLQGRL